MGFYPCWTCSEGSEAGPRKKLFQLSTAQRYLVLDYCLVGYPLNERQERAIQHSLHRECAYFARILPESMRSSLTLFCSRVSLGGPVSKGVGRGLIWGRVTSCGSDGLAIEVECGLFEDEMLQRRLLHEWRAWWNRKESGGQHTLRVRVLV